jgi:hypothetical protein
LAEISTSTDDISEQSNDSPVDDEDDRSANTDQEHQYSYKDIQKAMAELNFSDKKGKGTTKKMQFESKNKKQVKDKDYGIRHKLSNVKNATILENIVPEYDETHHLSTKEKKTISLDIESDKKDHLESKLKINFRFGIFES